MRFIYGKFYTSRPVDSRAVLFESFHGKEVSDSPLAMARALLSMPCRDEYKIYFSTTDADRDQPLIDALGLDIELVHIHSDKYAELLATAGIIVNNSSLPSYFTRRDGQIYLQTWHGTPWKTLGKKMRSGIETMYNVQHNFLQASHLLFPNEFTRDAIMGDYNLPELFTGKVIMKGYPRNNMFCMPERAAEIKHRCGDDGFRTIAYMPTWRGQDNANIRIEDFSREINGLLADLDEALADDQKLYVNLHPIVQKDVRIDSFRHIFPFPGDVDKYEFINSMDALITDYSSIFFDYSITGKPVILFTYDYDEYVAERGLYFDISELPFRRVDTTEQLKALLRSGEYLNTAAGGSNVTYEEYREKFLKYDSADAASVLMQYILDESKGISGRSDLNIIDYSSNLDRKWNVLDCKGIRSARDIDKISAMAQEQDAVVMFYKADFKPELSRYLHDYYADAFEYVFVTGSTPETYAERLSRNKSVKKAVRERDLVRKLGRLNTGKVQKYAASAARVDSIRTRGSRVSVECSLPASLGTVEDVILVYRSPMEDIQHSWDFKVSQDKGRSVIRASLDLAKLRHGCVYWDFYIAVQTADGRELLPASLGTKIRRSLAIGFYQCDLPDGYIAFPHITLDRTLALTNREATRYDDRMTRFREIAAYAVYKARKTALAKRNIWLVFEKFSSAAQDNGFYFFKYCMDNLSAEEKKNIFYVIDKTSKDMANLEPYRKHVINYMSFRHLLYTLSAKVYVGSDSKKHLYVWRPKPNLISGKMKNKDIHFLQHGVTALKKDDDIFGLHGSSPMTSITTTSKFEQQIMTENFGYSAEQAPVTGFTRWDVLHDTSTEDERIILVMPTWRAWLEEKTTEDFLASDYFRNYMELLADEGLQQCLKDNDVKLIFFIHPKFKDFLSQFSSPGENVEFIQFGSQPLNKIMMKCSMLITDYSSVCWDVYYMGKPVIFYQFDYDLYMQNHGSYLDMEHDLFGDRYTELPDVIDAIRGYVANGFKESERARSMRSRYFEYIDDDNSKRTYEYLKKRGY